MSESFYIPVDTNAVEATVSLVRAYTDLASMPIADAAHPELHAEVVAAVAREVLHLLNPMLVTEKK